MKRKLLHIGLFTALAVLAGACMSMEAPGYFEMDSDKAALMDSNNKRIPFGQPFTALVTIKQDSAGTPYLQFGKQKFINHDLAYSGTQRSMASLTVFNNMSNGYYWCNIGWIEPLDQGLFGKYGLGGMKGEGLDIIFYSGYTLIEDGFLSIHYNTWWAENPQHHDFYLIPDNSGDNPLTLHLVQDSHSDPRDIQSEGIICFDLNDFPNLKEGDIIIINWTKLDGSRGTADFEYRARE